MNGYHGEPFNGDVLTRYLMSRHNARVVRQVGSHLRLELPNGKRLGSLGSSKSNVPSSLLREVARNLDMTYGELREDMGFPVRKSGKPRGDTKAEPEERIGRQKVLKKLLELRRELDHIEKEVTERDRDPEVYRQAYDALHAGLDEASSYRRTQDLIRRHTPG